MIVADWLVKEKTDGRKIVLPEETAGAKRFDKSDPETVAMLRRFYDEAQNVLEDPGPPPAPELVPTGLKRLWHAVTAKSLGRALRNRARMGDWKSEMAHYALWTGPFDAVVEHHAKERPPKTIIATAEGREDAIGQFANFSEDHYAFGVQALMPDDNDVIYFAESELGEHYDPDIMGYESSAQILGLADTLERNLAAYRASDRKHDPGSMTAVEFGIKWLRFWGGHGHGIEADVRGAHFLADGTTVLSKVN